MIVATASLTKKSLEVSRCGREIRNAFGLDSEGNNFVRFTVSDHADVHFKNVSMGNR